MPKKSIHEEAIEMFTAHVEAKSGYEGKSGDVVTLARLHVPAQAPGIFNGDKTLSQQKTKGIQMKYDGSNLYWSYKGQWGAIPSGSVSEVIFE